MSLPVDSLAFTFCQTPVVYTRGNRAYIEVAYSDGRSDTIVGTCLDAAASQHILVRDGQVRLVHVFIEMKAKVTLSNL